MDCLILSEPAGSDKYAVINLSESSTMDKNTITLDGKSYEVSEFSSGIQQAVSIYNVITQDLQKAQIDVIRNQAALQTIVQQLTDAVKKELADRSEPQAE
jgi:vacuolar-type H+-ATPase subunit I/STV1